MVMLSRLRMRVVRSPINCTLPTRLLSSNTFPTSMLRSNSRQKPEMISLGNLLQSESPSRRQGSRPGRQEGQFHADTFQCRADTRYPYQALQQINYGMRGADVYAATYHLPVHELPEQERDESGRSQNNDQLQNGIGCDPDIFLIDQSDIEKILPCFHKGQEEEMDVWFLFPARSDSRRRLSSGISRAAKISPSTAYPM